MSSTGTFMVTCCLSACALSYFETNNADDVQSVWDDLFGLIAALGICASAGSITHKRFVFAITVIIGFPIISMLLLERLTVVVGLREWNSVAILILFGGLAGSVAFSVVSRRPEILITGTLAGAMGLMLTGLVAWAAGEFWPPRLTELELPTFATLIAFGPITGLALGVPFAVVEKKAARNRNERATN